MDFVQARTIFNQLIESDALKRHCESVSLVMEAYAKKIGEDPEKWRIAGLLHDADYEKYPDQHPNVIVKQLNTLGESRIAHAISAHHTGWGQSYDDPMDRYLLACDELTGFIIAVCWMRPTRIEGLTPKSVKKKLKTRSFAAGVDREEIERGIEIAGLDKDEHIAFIIDVLEQNKEDLGIASPAQT